MKVNLNKLLFYCLCLFAFLSPLEYIVNMLYGENFLLKPYRIAAILCILLGIIKSIYSGKVRLMSNMFFHIAIFVCFLTSAIRFIFYDLDFHYFFVVFFQFVLYYAAYIVSISNFYSEKEIEQLFFSVVAGSIVSLVSMYLDFFINGLSGDRLGGFFQNVNTAGFTLSIASIFLFYKGLKPSSNYIKSILYYLFSFLFILGVFFTGSRTAFAIVFFGILFLVLLSPLAIKFRILIFGLLIGFIFFDKFYNEIFLKSSLKSRIEATKSFGDDPRGDLNVISRSMSQDNYFMGLGLGQFYIQSPKYYHKVNNVIFFNRAEGLSTHNTYYTILVEWGLIGLIFYLLSIVFQLNLFIKRILVDDICKLQLSVFLLMLMMNFTGDNLISPIWWVAFIISTIRLDRSLKVDVARN